MCDKCVSLILNISSKKQLYKIHRKSKKVIHRNTENIGYQRHKEKSNKNGVEWIEKMTTIWFIKVDYMLDLERFSDQGCLLSYKASSSVPNIRIEKLNMAYNFSSQ